MNSGICRHGERRVITRKGCKTRCSIAFARGRVDDQAFGRERKNALVEYSIPQGQTLGSVESRKAAGEIGLEIPNVFQADMKTQGWAARLPLRRGAIVCAIERNDQAFKAAP